MTERADTRTCHKLAAEFRDLRPVIDPELDIVLVDCPKCGAQASDPVGMWRPARLVPRGKRLTVICEACGRQSDDRL